ncbi:MAG: GNAT family N-acetyltransferase [Calditrichaeota bacterium]|nr:GNAT family N-acetyltransferase [Calditrichota bacterium]
MKTTHLETSRLIICHLAPDDAPFILDLLNQPSFLQYIGDRGVRTLEDARNYIQKGPISSYERYGFGLFLVKLKDGDIPAGICGLLKRDTLPDVDIGFAFLPQFWSQGYAYESAAAVMSYGKNALGLKRIVAITQPDNIGSIRLLEKLGLRFEQMVRLAEDDVKLKLFAWEDGE